MAVFILACQNQQANQQTVKNQNSKLPSPTIDSNKLVASKKAEEAVNKKPSQLLQSFKTIPAEIDGCSGLFKMDDCKKSCDYVFAADLKGKAFIQINNKIIVLTRQHENVTEKSFHEVYTGKNYKLEIKATEVERLGDELSKYEGVIKLTSNGTSEEYTIVGEIGC